jgi:hypothetical protein
MFYYTHLCLWGHATKSCISLCNFDIFNILQISFYVRKKLAEAKFLSFKIFSICEISKIEIANITCNYFGDKSQIFAPSGKPVIR